MDTRSHPTTALEAIGEDVPYDFVQYLAAKLGEEPDVARRRLGHWLRHDAASSPGVRKADAPPRSGAGLTRDNVGDFEHERRQVG